MYFQDSCLTYRHVAHLFSSRCSLIADINPWLTELLSSTNDADIHASVSNEANRTHIAQVHAFSLHFGKFSSCTKIFKMFIVSMLFASGLHRACCPKLMQDCFP
jgi:hypothetical protein